VVATGCNQLQQVGKVSPSWATATAKFPNLCNCNCKSSCYQLQSSCSSGFLQFLQLDLETLVWFGERSFLLHTQLHFSMPPKSISCLNTWRNLISVTTMEVVTSHLEQHHDQFPTKALLASLIEFYQQKIELPPTGSGMYTYNYQWQLWKEDGKKKKVSRQRLHQHWLSLTAII
jgi:hypothetical protein